MKKNSSISKKNVFLRASAFVFAAVMLFSAAACSDNETEEVSSENTLTELKIEELDQDMTNFLIRFTDWYEVEEGKKPVYDSKKAGDGETRLGFMTIFFCRLPIWAARSAFSRSSVRARATRFST